MLVLFVVSVTAGAWSTGTLERLVLVQRHGERQRRPGQAATDDEDIVRVCHGPQYDRRFGIVPRSCCRYRLCNAATGVGHAGLAEHERG